MPRSLRRVFSIGLAVALAVLTASCADKGDRLPETGATLEGTITYRGAPVPHAMVIVVGGSSSATGNVGEDGRYKVENVPLGQVKIGVNTEAVKASFMMSQSYAGPEAKKAKKAAVKFVDVPAKYIDPEGSGITTTVNKGPNTYDIVIK